MSDQQWQSREIRGKDTEDEDRLYHLPRRPPSHFQLKAAAKSNCRPQEEELDDREKAKIILSLTEEDGGGARVRPGAVAVRGIPPISQQQQANRIHTPGATTTERLQQYRSYQPRSQMPNPNYYGDYDDDCDIDLEQPPQQQHQPQQTQQRFSVSFDNSLDEFPIVAELAPDEESVADRVARRLKVQLKEELENRWQEQQEQPRPSVLAQAVPMEPTDADVYVDSSSHSSSTSENFKICFVRRRSWGALLALLLIPLVGTCVGVVYFLSGFTNSKSGASSLDPSTMVPTPPTKDDTVLNHSDWNRLHGIIVEAASRINYEGLLQDPKTPQYAALQWMILHDDFSFIILHSGKPNNPIYNQTLVERYALSVLYYTTNGQRWKTKIDFLSPSSSVCDWNNGIQEGSDVLGVYCDGTVVTNLRLASNGLQGELPWELSLLSNLVQLDMDQNLLWGTFPSTYAKLTNLEALWFKSNSLTGTLPIAMGKMKSLASVDLENNELTGTLPRELVELPELFYLGLRLNSISGSLPAVSWGVNMQFFDIEGNQLTGNIPTELGKSTLMESLYLEKNFLSGTLPLSLGLLTGLKQLFVYRNSALAGTIPHSFRRLEQLKYFWFHGTNLTGNVDYIFCGIPFVNNLKGNCLADEETNSTQIECTCCNVCCAGNGETCEDMGV